MSESGKAAPRSGTLPVDDTRELSLLFHLNSEPWLNDEAYELASDSLPLVVPDNCPVVDLPAGADSPLVSLQRARHSCRAFVARQMPLATLAALLAGTQGIVSATRPPSSGVRRRRPAACSRWICTSSPAGSMACRRVYTAMIRSPMHS